jgi:ribulose-5-phosphate 4-epimerase/fuculose-1-phosphate aldolase
MDGRTLAGQIAWACRILAMDGHGDYTLGHVSARAGDLVCMKRNGIGLEEVTPEDVLTISLEREKVAGEGSVHLEAVLHTEVYRARPDVGAVVHAHPPYTTALAATTATVELINHDAVLFHDGLGVFAETAELITRPDQGAAVARALGNHRAVLLANHGVLVAGKDVPWAVYSALTLERAVMIQSLARSLGPLRTMSKEMAEQVFPGKYQDRFVETYWRYLIRQVRRSGLADGLVDPGNEGRIGMAS